MVVPALAPVIPLKGYQKNRLTPPVEPRIPEPAKLYCLIGLTFLLHDPVPAFESAQPGDCICGQCGLSWPCPQVLLAFRLREGF